MSENVQLTRTAYGAEILVNTGTFRVRKRYATMSAAADEALSLGLISANHHVELCHRVMASPLGLRTHSEAVDILHLLDRGFNLG